MQHSPSSNNFSNDDDVEDDSSTGPHSSRFSDDNGDINNSMINNNTTTTRTSDNDDDDDSKDVMTLPKSTHSLLFSEPVLTIPWAFGFAVFSISSWSLSFALIDAIQIFNIPAGVTFAVSCS